jgi:hypothetical protein
MSCAIVAARRIATIPPSSSEVTSVRLRVIGPPGARLAIASSSRSASSANTGPTSPSVRGARSSTCTRPLWVAQPRRQSPVLVDSDDIRAAAADRRQASACLSADNCAPFALVRGAFPQVSTPLDPADLEGRRVAGMNPPRTWTESHPGRRDRPG